MSAHVWQLRSQIRTLQGQLHSLRVQLTTSNSTSQELNPVDTLRILARYDGIAEVNDIADDIEDWLHAGLIAIHRQRNVYVTAQCHAAIEHYAFPPFLPWYDPVLNAVLLPRWNENLPTVIEEQDPTQWQCQSTKGTRPISLRPVYRPPNWERRASLGS